jgi:hypothetical protein
MNMNLNSRLVLECTRRGGRLEDIWDEEEDLVTRSS